MDSICPASSNACVNTYVCSIRKLCARLHIAPINLLFAEATPAVHFVGFQDEDQIYRAIQIFGQPDFIHRIWDVRATKDITEYDTIIFAKYHDKVPSQYSYDDSNQPDDPAAKER